MGETVDAIGYKADVPSRAKESISEKVHGVRSKIAGAGSQISHAGSQIADATPDAGDVKHVGRQAVSVAQGNPLGLAIGAAAVGFLAGMLIPASDLENERIGPIADQVKDQIKQTGQEAIERGKHVAQETVQTATESAGHAASEIKDQMQESAREQGEELKSSAQQSAEEVRQSAGN
jgi:gas vesicle protein